MQNKVVVWSVWKICLIDRCWNRNGRCWSDMLHTRAATTRIKGPLKAAFDGQAVVTTCWPRNSLVAEVSRSRVDISTKICLRGSVLCRHNQELSYRQQIARKLRTQYAEGIYRHKYYTVTLKCRLRVTQGHWKRNHWIDHTRLSSSRVIWHLILLWPWNVGYRSLKVIESGNIWKLGYGFLSPSIVTMAVSAAILEIFSVKE